jgi:hypothetical protein
MENLSNHTLQMNAWIGLCQLDRTFPDALRNLGYTVDIIDETCTCPDYQDREPEDGCKHVRRVAIEIEEETVPRPDGKLPTSAIETAVHNASVDSDPADDLADIDYQQAESAVIDAIQDREEEIARLQSEIEALEFVTETLSTIRNPDEEFGLDAIHDGQ